MRIHRDVLAKATDAQLQALRDNVLRHWKQVDDADIVVSREVCGNAIMVQMPNIVLGIEPDGYTHS